ncbi:FAD synthetase [Gymnodinialimonas sp. 57CJ19]|uniref:FAD synthetase n=1 Tax=Gymnodinialimonas sp. 57CJ19 TaxID=3138498 RepID=UPI0031345A30
MFDEYGPATICTNRPSGLSASVLTIGAFDGVHAGHQALVCGAIARARHLGVPAVVWTFDPPPKVFFGRANQLTPLAAKLSRISAFAPDLIVVSEFNSVFCETSADTFMDDVSRIAPREIHVGGDFRFGARQTGDVEMLATRFDVRIKPPILCSAGEVVSSTRIRALREQGLFDMAETLLSAPSQQKELTL